VLCFNDKKLSPGDNVHLSLRPEKLLISRDKPELNQFCNCLEGIVEDVVYKGTHTKFWVRVDGHRIGVSQGHVRFLLDTQPIQWKDRVFIWWHADDGFILERFNASDQKLVEAPSDKVTAIEDDPPKEEQETTHNIPLEGAARE
jgi:spermidine/putrescine transport system ATP-binding protein